MIHVGDWTGQYSAADVTRFLHTLDHLAEGKHLIRVAGPPTLVAATMLWSYLRGSAVDICGPETLPARADETPPSTVHGSITSPWVEEGQGSALDTGPGVHFLTSGSSGVPKRVFKAWDDVFRAAKAAREPATRAPLRWACGYGARTFAGLQVWSFVVQAKSSITYLLKDTRTIGLPLVLRDGCDAVSATPTVWRTLMMQVHGHGGFNLRLRQATLGGEIVDQRLLDSLMALFTPDRITHIYATSELGAVCAVHDGREGFPAAWLSRSTFPQLRVREGRLEVRPRDSCADDGANEGWIPTPDAVTVSGDRVLFTGRTDVVVNIGGEKFASEALEIAARRVLGAADVSIAARHNPISGAGLVVTVSRWPHDARSAEDLMQVLRADAAWPRVPTIVKLDNTVRLTEAGKKARWPA